MSETQDFDVIVLGAGPAGEVGAGRLAEAGLAVALVEQDLIGGECSFYACMPSKGLLRPGQALAEVRRVRGAAEAVSGELDVRAALDRRDEIIHDRDDSAQLPWLRERQITLVRGHGVFESERQVRVGDRILRARRAVVLASGSRAAIPPIPGLAEVAPWGNREATAAEAIPDSLLVLGGGVVAVELAQAYRSLGARVTIVEAQQRLIAREEPFASELLRESLERQGIEVLLGAQAAKAERVAARNGSQAVTLTLGDGRAVVGDELLVAVGRKPNTDALGLESLGLEGGDFVDVDETMRVPGHDWLYVIGDANGRALLTHMGKYQARVAADRILGRDTALCSDGPLSPRVIFTEPQIAAVGHTLASAEQAGLHVRAVHEALDTNAGESFVGHGAPGAACILVDEDRRVLVGATFAGVEVAEWLHAATIAIVAETPIERLAHAVPCFPTRSEVWLKLLEAYARD